jgi:dihydroorotate dehydrogenase (NAD+) catalytic subunit
MLMAGASAVGIGSAVWMRGVEALGDIAAELATFMEKEGYRNLDAIRGIAWRS